MIENANRRSRTGHSLHSQCLSICVLDRRLREEVRKLLNQAEAVDKGKDSRYGRDRRGDELPEELQRRETRIARIREAKRALEERAREQAKSEWRGSLAWPARRIVLGNKTEVPESGRNLVRVLEKNAPHNESQKASNQ